MARSALIKFITGLLVILVGWFGVWGFYRKSSDLRASIKNTQDLIEEERASLQKLIELESLIVEREAEIAKLKIAIPPDRDIASLIASFEEAASVNGLALVALEIFDSNDAQLGIAAIEDTGPRPFKTLNIQVELSGRYGAFQSFLTDIESSFPLVDPADVSLRPSADSSVPEGQVPIDPILDFVLNIETYYLD